MHTFDGGTLGWLIVLLLVVLVVIKRAATGSILETPQRGVLFWLVNIFNLFFLLVANPLAAILLMTGHLKDVDPTSLGSDSRWFLTVVEIGGLVIYLAGFCLMGWALIKLDGSYQLGGSDPRTTDTMITDGPYALIRHPMYTAALSIALGLACLTNSLVCLGAFVIYLVLILLLIPVEEESLLPAYGEQYVAYRQRVRKLLPFIF